MVKSPGIPHKAEIVQKAMAEKMPIISEIELASRCTKAKIIAVIANTKVPSAYSKITSPHGTKFSIKQIHDR